MLPSQRALFDIPRDICFLNAASWSPLPLAVQEAGRAAVGRKGQPWKLGATFQSEQYERARKAAASLIGADPADVALIPSVGYGVSTAGKVLTIPRGSRVLVLQDDHTSPVLEWMSRAEAGGFTVEYGAAAGRRRLDLFGAGGDRAQGGAAARPGLDLLRALVGRRRARHAARIGGRPRPRVRRCWSTPRTMSACARSTSKASIPIS